MASMDRACDDSGCDILCLLDGVRNRRIWASGNVSGTYTTTGPIYMASTAGAKPLCDIQHAKLLAPGPHGGPRSITGWGSGLVFQGFVAGRPSRLDLQRDGCRGQWILTPSYCRILTVLLVNDCFVPELYVITWTHSIYRYLVVKLILELRRVGRLFRLASR